MRTRGELKAKLQPMLMAVSTSTYFTVARIEAALDDAYILVAAAKPWPDVKKGFVTSTLLNQEYYDYPANCQSGSVFKISVDGDTAYTKMNFEDYLKKYEDDPTCTDKRFAEYGRQYFIHPIPQSNGNKNLILWGVIQAAKFVNDNSITMFTDWADNVNGAILQYAYADLIQNLDAGKSAAAIAQGKGIINDEWKKVTDRQQRNLKDTAQFDVPDFFATGSSSIGNFSIKR